VGCCLRQARLSGEATFLPLVVPAGPWDRVSLAAEGRERRRSQRLPIARRVPNLDVHGVLVVAAISRMMADAGASALVLPTERSWATLGDVKGIARGRVSPIKPTLEPVTALTSRPVRERFQHHRSGFQSLHRIVCQRMSCAQRLLDVFRFQFTNRSLPHPRCPNPSQTVGLQFDANTKLIYLLRITSRLHSLSSIFNTDQVLHMVAHFVRDHVGLCEIAGCVIHLFECVEETKIEVDLMISRAIEWSRNSVRGATGGLRGSGE
jgi:hypothetical protein